MDSLEVNIYKNDVNYTCSIQKLRWYLYMTFLGPRRRYARSLLYNVQGIYHRTHASLNSANVNAMGCRAVRY